MSERTNPFRAVRRLERIFNGGLMEDGIVISEQFADAYAAFDQQYSGENAPEITRLAAENLFFELAAALQVATPPKTQREKDIVIAETVAEELRGGTLALRSEDVGLEIAKRIREQANG